MRSDDLDDSSPETALADGKARHRHREREAPRSRASWIQEEDAVFPFGARTMGVAADDRMKALGSGIDIQLFQIVEDVDAEAAYVEGLGHGKSPCPGTPVVVASHRNHRRDPPELLEHLRPADVPGVDDQLAPPQCRDGFGADQVVGVRDDPDENTQLRSRSRSSSAVFFSCG